MEKLTLTVKEAAKYTGIGISTLKYLAREHRDFPCLKVGVKLLIFKDKIGDWLEKHRGETL
ncbi:MULTISPECIES: helix-turn-helix domain-containing protein [Fusobacterium]|jgi:hypothetical protein|uniref:helix-turn-helix domain-containing protein n=1 Tax=Fusobacterium TaxID=848 RepID=UPI00201B337F|nr:helix-turn-helix domain-containing protein [Fusobacterium nucleatum]MCL4584189.1 hypothetical protein [Fusobacterium nucleatum YWH7055]DAR23582.1 MAG TPA: helix-turn-helix domain protein [Caudoviricetes sp.]